MQRMHCGENTGAFAFHFPNQSMVDGESVADCTILLACKLVLLVLLVLLLDLIKSCSPLRVRMLWRISSKT
jgi:hypothetical protein